MNNIFSNENEARLDEIVADYRKIFEKASYMAVEMAKMEEEMKGIMEEMDKLKEEEMSIYMKTAEEQGISIDAVKIEAGNLMLHKKAGMFPNTENVEN